MQTPTITAAPSSPQTVLEGQNITLEWTYNIGIPPYALMLLIVQPVGGSAMTTVAQKLSNRNLATPNTDYAGRITGSVNDTFTTISILFVKTTDSGTYSFTIQNDNLASSPQSVVIVEVQGK